MIGRQVRRIAFASAALLVLGLPTAQGAKPTPAEPAAAVERCRAAAWFPSHGPGTADAFVDWPTAIRLCEAALALAPEDPAALAAYGRALHATKRYTQGLDAMRRAAATGHPAGQYGMGFLAQDKGEAMAWYRLAAQQGNAGAQYALGLLYDNGDGVAEDDAEAVTWYHQAARQGHGRALNRLGEMYATGQGVARDPPAALGLFLAALLGTDRGDWGSAAARSIVRFDLKDAAPGLIAALGDPDEGVRALATQALGGLGRIEAVPGLRTALKDRSNAVRSAAVQSLGDLGAKDALPDLVQALRDRNADVRLTAVGSLGRLGANDAVSALTSALRDGDAALRGAAAAVLSTLAAKEVLPRLTAARRVADPDVRRLAARAMSDLGAAQALAPMTAALRDRDVAVRRVAAYALGELGGKESVTGLLAALDDRDPDVRRSAASWLGRIGDKRAVAGLLTALKDRDSGVRWSAVYSLGALGDKRAVPALVSALGDAELAVPAIEALGALKALPQLMRALKASDPNARYMTVQALGKIGEEARSSLAGAPASDDVRVRKEVLTALVAALGDDDAWVRREAATALGLLRDKDAVPALLAALKDVDQGLRTRAARVLGELGATEAIPDLLVALNAGDDDLRQPAALALGKLGVRDALPGFPAALRGHDDGVCAAAAESLGELGARDAVPELLAVYADAGDDLQRYCVIKALVKLGETQAVPDLMSALAPVEHVIDEAVDVDSNRGVLLALTRALWSNDRMAALPLARVREQAPVLSERIGGAGVYSRQLLAVVHFATPGNLRGEVLRLMGRLRALVLDPASLTESGLAADLAAIRAELGEDVRPEDNPCVGLLLAHLFSEGGQHQAALGWSKSALDHLDPAEVAPAAVLRGIRAWSLARLGQAQAGLEELELAERELLPWVTTFERRQLDLPLGAWVAKLKGQLLADAEEMDTAQAALETAIGLAKREPGPTDEARERELKYAHAELTGVFGARQAQERTSANAHEQIEPRTAPERASDVVRLEQSVEAELRNARAAGENMEAAQEAYGRAHKFMEELALKRQGRFMADGLHSQASARDEALSRLGALERDYQAFSVRPAAVPGTPSAGPNGEAGGPPQTDPAELRRQRNAAFQRLKGFQDELLDSQPEVAVLVGARPASLRALLKILRPEEVLVQYLLLADKGYAFVFSRERGVDVVDLAVGRQAIEPVVRAWRAGLEAGLYTRGAVAIPPDPGGPAGPDPGEKLARWLLAPLASRLNGVKHLILVPNGPLHLLPFAALPVGAGYLVSERTLSVLSASSLAVVAGREPAVARRLLAVGNPTPPGPEWSDLPGAQGEVAAVRAYFADAQLYPAAAAKDRFVSRNVLMGQDLAGWSLHLAMHGRAGRREETQLVFSDGYLGVREVYGLALDGSPLVVLSACETGLGEQLAGDEVVSLANGFLFAGARRVIASLWRVPDQATRELMDALYRAQAEGAGPAEALALAQRALIAAGHPPRDWAAFTLTGI